MQIKTATGKTFEADMVVETKDPERLYVHIISSTVSQIARTFTSPSELPIDGYPDYTAFVSLNTTPTNAINVVLKKG